MDGSTGFSFDPSRLNKATAADYSSSASESDDEYLAPAVDPTDNDFGDFNPRKRRRLGGNNKEKAALGIFGSDSEDDGPGKKWKRKTLRNKGMNFVSNSEARPAEEDEASDEDMGRPSFRPFGAADDNDSDDKPVLGNGRAESEEDEEDDEDQSMAGVGLGFAGTKFRSGGYATQAHPRPAASTPPQPSTNTGSGFGGSGMMGRGFVPSSAHAPVLDENVANSSSPPRNKPQVSAFSTKGNGKVNAKSFGARMMAKMGYQEGTGLGKEGQGRNVIIEANLRPQGIGLGAVREKSEKERQEEKRQAELRGETVVDSDEEERKRKKSRQKKKTIGNAFDSAGSTPRRQKKKYLTAEELKATAPGLHIPDAFAPILDMTAPESKMLSSTSGIMTPTSGVPDSAEIVGAKKLVKRAHADLLAFSEEWKTLEERKTWVNLELHQREHELEDLRSDFDRLQVFTDLISNQLTEATGWDEVIACLKQVASKGSTSPELTDVAVAVLYPYLRDPDWSPLEEPSRFAKDMNDISSLLLPAANGKAVNRWDSTAAHGDGVYRSHHKATTSYESMMYKCWLPRVLACVREWDPMDPTPMLSIVDNWAELLPPFVRAQLVDAVVRALESTLSNWNPRRQSHHLPHTWLFPWLQHLPDYHLDPKGTGLVADVRRKFRQLIDVWEFSRGLVPGLTQWRNVLGSQWQPLVMSHILPSMGRYLRLNFRVDPSDQEPYLPVLTGALRWEPLLGREVVGEMLVQDVFPMWVGKLEEWMGSEEVDLEEVAEWYGWWRGVVLRDLGRVGRVGRELDKGLRIMNMV